MGIQVSEVENAKEARAIVRPAKYPPIGNRGISGQGPHTGYKSYGASGPLSKTASKDPP
jgi:2-keto-3-deoxy-L-rhamnonate aldolase RhmA